jgi:hypothetical protein
LGYWENRIGLLKKKKRGGEFLKPPTKVPFFEKAPSPSPFPEKLVNILNKQLVLHQFSIFG